MFHLHVLSLLFPLDVTCYGYYDVEPVEQSLEGDALVNVKHAADYIHHYPEEPLLKVFPCQRPQADKGEGIGETVEHGHGGVRPSDQYVIGCCPGKKEEDYHGQVLLTRHIDNRQGLVLFMGATEAPEEPAIDCCEGVITRHACIAVESVAPIEHHIEGWHDHAYEPQPYTGTILEPDIQQPKHSGEYVEIVKQGTKYKVKVPLHRVSVTRKTGETKGVIRRLIFRGSKTSALHYPSW